ncbi:hypothetical protein HDU93_001984 [Gonapodya sp. JEL0774]|nr:hypothetical protein HDU93_001984 [Gonapodya sp. JEL0774]
MSGAPAFEEIPSLSVTDVVSSVKRERDGLVALPTEVARRVHAEQVVSSVIDVVRELVENALDASATRIKITLAHSGLHSISISDNGIGIPSASVGDLFKPYHTSKLRSLESLPHICTFGFRGEALYAIASLGEEAEVSTMCEGETVGRRLTATTGGVVKSSSKIALPHPGTTITVRKLFNPHPVRRAHALQHPPQRLREQVFTLVSSYAVECPHVGWTVSGKDAPTAPSGLKAGVSNKRGPPGTQGKDWTISVPATGAMEKAAQGIFPFLALGAAWVFVERTETFPVLEQAETPPLDVRIRAILPKPGCLPPPHPPPPSPIHINRRTCIEPPPQLGAVVDAVLDKWKGTLSSEPLGTSKQKNVFCWWSITLEGGNGVDANLAPDKRHILLADEDDARIARVVEALADQVYGNWESTKGGCELGEATHAEDGKENVGRRAPVTPQKQLPQGCIQSRRTPLTQIQRLGENDSDNGEIGDRKLLVDRPKDQFVL